MFKKSAVCIAIGIMGFGINYDPIVTKDSNDLLAFVKGFGWGASAHASQQCQTEGGGRCENIVVRPGPNPWYPWDPGYPGEPGPPDCEWGCDDNGGGGGGTITTPNPTDPSLSEVVAQESLQYLEQNSVQLANDLASLVATINLDYESKIKLNNMTAKLNALISVLRSGQNITNSILYNELENLGPEILGLLLGVPASYLAGVALTAFFWNYRCWCSGHNCWCIDCWVVCI